MQLVLSLLVNAVALWCAAEFVTGIRYSGSVTGLLVLALVFGAVNTFIKPVLKLLAFPLTLITLGLFTLVINAGMLLLTARLAGGTGFQVDGFVPALLGAILVSVVGTFLGALVRDDKDKDERD